MKSVTAAQMRELDRRTIEAGTPGRVLMERAGKGVVDAMLHRWFEYRGPILVLAGKGNNGGDAFVVARHLAQRAHAPVTLLLACKKSEIKGDALFHFKRLPGSVKVVSATSGYFESARVIVDGLLGTGLQGEVRTPYRELIERVNSCERAAVVAIDVPSGLNADTGQPLGVAIRAGLTVTMGLPKIGLLRTAAADRVGELEVVDIGIQPQPVSEIESEAELVAPSDMAPLFPRRKRTSHKGDYGHLFVLAGAEGYHGAAVLCAEAAARMGAGLVTLGVPRSIYAVVAAQCREVMVKPFAETADGSFSMRAIDDLPIWFERCDAVAFGPGLSQNEETRQFVVRILRDCPRPMVVDADALNALTGHAESLALREAPTILTPHPGEMGRLINQTTREVQSDRWTIAHRFARQVGMTVVLKGAGTVIAAPHGPVWVNMTGGPALAKGGSGDALTGMIGSLLAQGFSPHDASRAGVFLHGRAADIAALELGDRSVLARDVIAKLGEAIQSLP